MDRDQNASENLFDRENKLIAEILSGFRGLIKHGADRVSSTASTGQAAYNSMAIEILMSGLTKSTEDLLGLTRQLRELWVVGPLKKPGEGDDAVQLGVQQDATAFFSLMNGMRSEERSARAQETGGCMTYREGPMEGVPMPKGPEALGGPAGQGVGAGPRAGAQGGVGRG
ncbi:hypothetical protein B0T25DRAFT_499552 [Lasiosphaeria hispida]|uniref:Uncharacterized protein n=1 Tax=Lasiosphaeria hispida TaxID=260671 RepID=A0AAJ0HN15_9PEZI|nr:hypothetical protein B0T25DRAFT_499552 [Lasiosphaeria hispida]